MIKKELDKYLVNWLCKILLSRNIMILVMGGLVGNLLN